MREPIVWLVIVIRVISGIYIFFNPLWGFIIYLFFDWADWYMLNGRRQTVSVKEYHLLDKPLDWVGYLAMLLVSVKFGAFWYILPVFVFRFIGQLIFLSTHKQYIFAFFPNLIQPVFICLVLLKTIDLKIGLPMWIIFVILSIFSAWGEIWLHVFWPWFVKRKKYPKILTKIGVKQVAE